MKKSLSSFPDDLTDAGVPEEDLWFLPGPEEHEPDDLPPGPRAEPNERHQIEDWVKAEATHAAKLARVAGRLGALDERLGRGPEGWHHRLALIEASELSWFAGDRISADRLALWMALRLSGAHEDSTALARVSWAVRRLSGGPGPLQELGAFLGRHEMTPTDNETELFGDRAAGWLDVMEAGRRLHPISRACVGYHLWSLAGLSLSGDRIEAAVTASRIASSEGTAAVFAPLAMGGVGGLRAGGTPEVRLLRWLDGMQSAILTSMRHLDEIEAWSAKAATVMAPLSGRTPELLRAVLVEWPMVSAPMAEMISGVSRAAVQRNIAWMQDHGLVREVTGQGRFRMWRAAI